MQRLFVVSAIAVLVMFMFSLPLNIFLKMIAAFIAIRLMMKNEALIIKRFLDKKPLVRISFVIVLGMMGVIPVIMYGRVQLNRVREQLLLSQETEVWQALVEQAGSLTAQLARLYILEAVLAGFIIICLLNLYTLPERAASRR